MIRRVISQPTERQHVADQINAAMIFSLTDFVNVLNLFHDETNLSAGDSAMSFRMLSNNPLNSLHFAPNFL